MWPWEHLAVGYLLYSVSLRLVYGNRPGDAATVALAFATQLPDLVDKPLAWVFDVLPSGLSLAHSLLFALPLSALVVLVAVRRGSPAIGSAFAIGYLSHLAGDVAYPYFVGDGLRVGFLLWPLVPASPEPTVGFLSLVIRFFEQFLAFLGTPRGQLYVVFEALLLATAIGLWMADGCPILTFARRSLFNRS